MSTGQLTAKLAAGAALMVCMSVAPMPSQAEPVPKPLQELTVSNAMIATYDYGGNGNPEQTVDVHYESNATRRPCMYVIHGGSWAAGSRVNTRNTSIRFENEGFVVFNIDYRKTTDYGSRLGVPWAVQRNDVITAVDWARANAQKFGFDPDRCGIYGFSAGGHLATVVGLSGGGRVRAIVSASGALQPHRIVAVAYSDPRVGVSGDLPTASNKVLSGWVHTAMRCPMVTWTECSKRYSDFKPENLIQADDPPMMIFQGTKDPAVPSGTGRAFRYWLIKRGVPCQLTTASSSGTACLIEGINWGHTEHLAFDNGWRQAKMINFLKTRTADRSP